MLYQTKLMTLTLSISKELVVQADYDRIKSQSGLTLGPYLLTLIDQGLRLPKPNWSERVFDCTESDEMVLIACQTRNTHLFGLSQAQVNYVLGRVLNVPKERNHDN